MGAIVLDASRVNSYILPSLNKSENLIQTAYNTSVSLRNSLPSSFKQRSAVNEIVNEIYNIKKDINNIEGIIDSKLTLSKRIESKSESRVSSIASAASQIGSVVGAVGGATLGTRTGGIVGATAGDVVESQAGKSIADTAARIVNNCKSVYSQIESGVSDAFDKIGAFTSKLCTAIGNGVETAGDWITDADTWEKIGTTITDGATAVWNWGTDPNTWKKIGASIGNVFKTAGDWVADPENWKKLGSTISEGVTAAWNWAKDIENWKKLGASIVNGVIALVKGVVSLVEAIGDFVILLDSVSKTGYAAIQDVATAILTDGKLDWNATKKLWDRTKSIVAYNWTNKIFDSLYNTGAGKWLDEYAYSPFKSDGMGCEIIEGIGYVAGVIVLTICTFGAGGVATAAGATVSTTTAMAMTATAAGIGKYTAEEWNKNSISVNYGDTNVDFALDYEKYLEIENLKQGESTTISQQITLEDGSIQRLTLNITSKGNGEYLITDKDGNLASLNSLNESSTVKGLAIGGLKGAWEGAQWYVGGKIGTGEFTKITGKITSPVLKKITTSGTRVLLDTATGVVEVPFQSLVAMMSEGKTWNEAWESQGGWQAVGTQAGIAGLSSLGGEVFDLTKVLKTGAEIDENAISKKVVEIDDNTMLTNYRNSRSNIEFELSKVNNQIETNKKEWFELYQKTKTPEYKSAIENIKNGYAGSLTDMDSALVINKRMKELQSDMDILVKSKGELEISLTNVSDNITSLENQIAKANHLGKEGNTATIQEVKIDDLKYKKTNSIVYATDYMKSNINKFRYTDTNLIDGLNTQIKQNGLYHFLKGGDEIADKILKEKEIWATGEGIRWLEGRSYGVPKTFFFSGVPDVGAFASNIDNLPLKTQAIKINPTDEMLNSSKLRVRNFDDGAISWDGRVNLEGTNATKEYFVLARENEQLVYKNVSEDVFNNYEFTSEGKALSEFVKKKSNINAVKQDYYAELSMKSSNAKLSNKIKSSIKNISSLNNVAVDINKNIDLSEELAFFGSNKIFNRNKYSIKTKVDLSLTATQKQTVDQINNFIRNGQNCVVTYNSTSEISSLMLDQIDDLSKVEIKLLDGLGDSNGSLKSKYMGNQKYDARITYQGYEMKSILERIENLQSKVDMSLPVEQRAKQIYEILSTEIPVMRDFGNYQYGHHVSASLRGLIPDNLVGKEGLVCAGYASVYKELCDRTGIKCDYVRGIGIVDPLRNGNGGGHAWNVVYTDNGMIPVDVTWKASGDGTKEWFGGSDEFVKTHIADADEFSKNYDGMIPSVMFESSSDKLNKVLNILDSKYGSRQESIKRLQGYLDEQNINIITRTDGAREIISTIDDRTIKNFIIELDINKKLNNVLYIMDQKNGVGYGLRVLKEYLNTGNSSLITRTDGARDFICSLNMEDIKKYLETF